MNWLIRQLFGAHAMDNLTDKLKAEVGSYLLSNPNLSEAVVSAWAIQQSTRLIAQVLMHFPGWAAAVLYPLLESEIENLIAAIYKSLMSAVPTKTAAHVS